VGFHGTFFIGWKNIFGDPAIFHASNNKMENVVVTTRITSQFNPSLFFFNILLAAPGKRTNPATRL